jgi:hypothetical protein
LILLAAACLSTTASALDGAWTAYRDDERSDRIYLQMTRGRNNNMGTTLRLDAFTGLTGVQIDAATRTPASFALRREAGDATFEGTFRKGKGAGEFTFTPRPAFLEGVRALGVDVDRHGKSDRDELLFGLALNDVTVAFIQSMIAEGYKVSLDEYLALRIFNVTPEFIHEMRDLGFKEIEEDELVACKIHGVTPAYVRDMRAQGWDLSLDDYQASRIHGATPQFAAQMRKLGYSDLSHDDLMAFRIHGVTPDFIRDARAGATGRPDRRASTTSAPLHPRGEGGRLPKVPFQKLMALHERVRHAIAGKGLLRAQRVRDHLRQAHPGLLEALLDDGLIASLVVGSQVALASDRRAAPVGPLAVAEGFLGRQLVGLVRPEQRVGARTLPAFPLVGVDPLPEIVGVGAPVAGAHGPQQDPAVPHGVQVVDLGIEARQAVMPLPPRSSP